jgi:hypothetical protein
LRKNQGQIIIAITFRKKWIDSYTLLLYFSVKQKFSKQKKAMHLGGGTFLVFPNNEYFFNR